MEIKILRKRSGTCLCGLYQWETGASGSIEGLLIKLMLKGNMNKSPAEVAAMIDLARAGSYQGIPQNDVGIRTDVLDCCSKAEGMVMLLRSMAPQVIAVDEIGNYEDIRAIEMTLNSGCKLLATVHGSSIDEIRKKPLLERLIKEHVFERYIILQKETAGKIGKVREIYDERGTCLYQNTSFAISRR